MRLHHEIVNFETSLRHKNGSAIPFNLSFAPLFDAAGTLEGFLIIGKDVSLLKRANDELQQRGEELEELAYIITHNLKTPIVSVQGFANLLMEEAGNILDEESKHYLQRIQKNVETMNAMINDLLNFSKYGKMDKDFELIDLNALMLSIREEFQHAHNERPVKFAMPAVLPRIYGNADGLRTLFSNLIDNAIKYRRAEVPLEIHISFDEFPRFIAFHVEDNGIGVDEAFRKNAFKPFHRGSNVEQREGSGIGLAICQRIVKQHGGLISINSNASGGATISFTIPKSHN